MLASFIQFWEASWKTIECSFGNVDCSCVKPAKSFSLKEKNYYYNLDKFSKKIFSQTFHLVTWNAVLTTLLNFFHQAINNFCSKCETDSRLMKTAKNFSPKILDLNN